jgi:hypothetical protein
LSRYFVLPDALPLDTLLVDDAPKPKGRKKDALEAARGCVLAPFLFSALLTCYCRRGRGGMRGGDRGRGRGGGGTVIRFIDDKDFRPTEQLEALQDASHLGSPFSALDQLYVQILSTVPACHRLLPILHARRTRTWPGGLGGRTKKLRIRHVYISPFLCYISCTLKLGPHHERHSGNCVQNKITRM